MSNPPSRSRRPSRRVAGLGAFLLALAALGGSAGAQADATTTVELNKLEPAQDACRVYLTVRNDAAAYDSLNLDLVLFGKDGVIARRLAAEIGPLRAQKRQVKLFDLPGIDCGAVGSVLVNDVLACQPENDPAACLGRLRVSSRVGGVEFAK